MSSYFGFSGSGATEANVGKTCSRATLTDSNVSIVNIVLTCAIVTNPTKIKGAIYSTGSSGEPTTLLGSTNENTISSFGVHEEVLSFSSPLNISIPTQYCITFASDQIDILWQYSGVDAAYDVWNKAITYASEMTDPFGAADDRSILKMCIWANYTTGGVVTTSKIYGDGLFWCKQ
jgi:hypothetical protein